MPAKLLTHVKKIKPVRYSAVELLVALGIFFISAPLIHDLPGGDFIDSALLTLVMVSAVRAVGDRRRILVIALILLAPALAGKWLSRFWPDLLPPEVFLSAYLVFFAFIVARLVAFIVRAPWVDANVLCAGVSGFLMLGLLWTPAYLVVARYNPAAFAESAAPGAAALLDQFNAFYFSFITLCTVGYGDITPASKAARMLAITEAITGMFYMAVLISRLVSVYSQARRAPEAREADAASAEERGSDTKER
jgi:hypothetical protein